MIQNLSANAQEIVEIYNALRSSRSPWVALTDIRAAADDLTREEQDEAFAEILNEGTYTLEPEPLGHRTRGEYARASVILGGEARHKMGY